MGYDDECVLGFILSSYAYSESADLVRWVQDNLFGRSAQPRNQDREFRERNEQSADNRRWASAKQCECSFTVAPGTTRKGNPCCKPCGLAQAKGKQIPHASHDRECRKR